MNINDVVKELNKIDKELLLLERDIYVNPKNKDVIEKLVIDETIYNVIYTDLVEPSKIYISNNKNKYWR